MKIIAIMLLCIPLAGCLVTPVKRNFPDIPPVLQETCPDLQKIPKGTTEFSKVLGVVTDNYAEYNNCALRNQAWQTWYAEQKRIFEEVK